ncbi:MAG: PKD domain-containing protein [Lewinellaceae bacterium]|nr:PKD domain-containing protein [Lewinellaceae bacterium]
MRTGLVFSIAMFLSLSVYGQPHDFTWLIGYTTAIPPQQGDLDGISLLNFGNGNLESLELVNLDYDFTHNNSAFSDSSGNLIAFFNGIQVEDASYHIMENGQEMDKYIVTGSHYRKYSDEFLPQGSIFLPWPAHPDSLFLIYGGKANYGSAAQVILGSLNLSYALIDLKGNNGLGKMVEREQMLLEDTIGNGQITACKHANGRDWWVLIWEADAARVYRFLVNPKGISSKGQQTVDFPIYSGAGQTCFSPDGRFYAIYNGISDAMGTYLNIFDFDRCLGLLSNQRQFHHPVGLYGGVSISPNSRFLYGNFQDTVFQYDLYADDIIGSQKLVVVRDDYPYPKRFYLSQLAPDGKIYTSSTSGSRWLHIIHNPDEEGAACQYHQRGLLLPTVNSYSVPNFPNYRLGPLDGSPCDTLGLDNIPKAWWRYDQDTLDPLLVRFHDLSYYEPAAWSWDFGDGSAGSSERHPTHQFNSTGAYQVCLTVDNPDGSDTHCKMLYLGVSGQNAPISQRLVSVSPNPFGEHLNLVLDGQESNDIRFLMYNWSGRLVLEAPVSTGANELNTEALPVGIYFWEVILGNDRIGSGKLIRIK